MYEMVVLIFVQTHTLLKWTYKFLWGRLKHENGDINSGNGDMNFCVVIKRFCVVI